MHESLRKYKKEDKDSLNLSDYEKTLLQLYIVKVIYSNHIGLQALSGRDIEDHRRQWREGIGRTDINDIWSDRRWAKGV